VKGNVEAADKVDIRKDARLEGDIVSARISIEDGALFKGSIDIRKVEVKAGAAAAPVISNPAPTPAPAQTAVPVAAGGVKR
jgi:cytoskeletal protein CcmA (bactofilin family)